MKKILIAGIILMNISGFAQSSKDAKIKEMINITGVDKLGQQAFSQMLTIYKQSYKDVPEEFWKDFQNEVSTEELAQLYIPIYSKYYSETDLDEILKFYKSSVGKKMISTMPSLMQDSMEAGKEWGQKIGQKVIDKISQKYGYQDPPPPMSAPSK